MQLLIMQYKPCSSSLCSTNHAAPHYAVQTMQLLIMEYKPSRDTKGKTKEKGGKIKTERKRDKGDKDRQEDR
jgi:hypothetical protein